MSNFGENKEDLKNKKSLIIYFSRADENYFGGTLKYIEKGNTEIVAGYIHELTGADMFKVERKIPYSRDYKTCIEESKKENNEDARPEIAHCLNNIDEYEVIYIGSPIYWGSMPAELFTALKEVDFTGKTIRVFTTHEGSGLGNVLEDVKKICSGAEVLDGLAIVGSQVKNSKQKVEDWI